MIRTVGSIIVAVALLVLGGGVMAADGPRQESGKPAFPTDPPKQDGIYIEPLPR